MKKLKALKDLVREVIELLIKFFKHYGLNDEMVAVPPEVKKMGFKVGVMNFGMTLISTAFAFILKLTNVAIEHRFLLLGVILFMMYRGQQVIREAFYLFEGSESEKLNLIFEGEIVLRGSNIIGRVSEKVYRFDEESKVYRIMDEESVLNSIKNYLQNFWKERIRHIFDLSEMVSVLTMLVVAIITNTTIPQYIFIILIVIFVILTFLSSAYTSINRKNYYKKSRKYNNEEAIIINDLLRVPLIVTEDLDMRINKLKEAVTKSNENVKEFHHKLNVTRLIITIIEAFSQYGIIIFYLMMVNWESISLSTITEITAVLLIVETALGQIGRIAETVNGHSERIIVLEKEEHDLKLILDVYYKEMKNTQKPKLVETINIKPFSIKYVEESENDKPFTLVSEEEIHIEKCEIACLYGPSGSGKSTFMKMLTERIRLEKSTEIPATSRYLFYDERLRFGSLSIFEELFCCSKDPNFDKMHYILEMLHLWSEIKANCHDVWQWMKEKHFDKSLSNGQKQRLIIAKMLYWMDNDIDVLVLDECTSGLDDKSEYDSADAERILEQIVRYANSDKKRIIILSTHQNIDGFKSKLSNEYTFRNLMFRKEGDKNLVEEI